MIRAGIYGATGYTGQELTGLLARHPDVEVAFCTSSSEVGKNLSEVSPSAPPILLIDPSQAPLDETEVVFLCLPHGASAPIAAAALEAGARVIDLSADFRLRDADLYAKWYGLAHPAPELLGQAVYGLSELAGDELTGARLAANPGCYPTSVLLALYPLVTGGAVAGTVIIDAKSGVSGAGRAPSLITHFVEVADNLTPYKLGRTHRHLPEMEQALHWWSSTPPSLVFCPHLLPVPRGLLSTIYIPLSEGWDEAGLAELYKGSYRGEPFIRLLPLGQPATLAHVNHTNRCAIGITLTEATLVITSAIDNLGKGAAGQAVQNMNLMFGLDKTAGLV